MICTNITTIKATVSYVHVDTSIATAGAIALAPVVETMDNAIHWINHYPLDKHWDNQLSYPLDSNLSTGTLNPVWERGQQKYKDLFGNPDKRLKKPKLIAVVGSFRPDAMRFEPYFNFSVVNGIMKSHG